MKQVIHFEDIETGWIRWGECDAKIGIPSDPEDLKVCPICQRQGFMKTKITDIPVDPSVAKVVAFVKDKGDKTDAETLERP